MGKLKEIVSLSQDTLRVPRLQNAGQLLRLFADLFGLIRAYTLRTEYAILRRAHSYAVELELMETNPADGVETPKVKEREPVLLSDDQLTKLLEACGEDDMLRLLYCCY